MTALVAKFKLFEELILFIGITFVSLVVLNFDLNTGPIILLGISFSALAFYFLSKVNGFFILSYVLLSITFLENNEGIELIEIPFYIFSLALIFYVSINFLIGSFKVETTLDLLFLFLTSLLGYALIIGLINGSNTYKAFGELTSFLGVFLYFPLRKYMICKQFQAFLFGIIIIIIFFVAIKNVINYRLLILQAFLPWQTTITRIAANEFIILIGSFLFLNIAAGTKSKILQLVSTGIFLFLMAALILTQSRGYWLAFAFGGLVIFGVIKREGKFRILLTFLLITAIALIISNLFFSDQLMLVFEGLRDRVKSIGSGKLDISLHERLLESKTVIGLILENPITGYGFGYLFTKKILFYDIFIQTSYVHNGYLATWFKFGIIGLLIILSIWILCIKNAIQVYRNSSDRLVNMIMLTICGTVSGILLVNNTSPQVLTFESNLLVTVFAAYLCTLRINKK